MPDAQAKIEKTSTGQEIVFRMPVESPMNLSKSGKSYVVASTRGAVEPGLQVKGMPVRINFTAYCMADV